ncbi:RHS repeat-associated protein [Aquimarina sp. MAR_2010_214]|uniref:RHS repeat domain-containing protein n=1 Tax=Aquimarina sp. MAR_2010_214 TaxID=1250026 RepID=UPI000C7023BE|nr:RHS repeat-associated core domain-containing protein [Aquimarina sp. MAR_2010_214]PKV49585.1 RHS repeat-associated protein [Aquimarina sp. MAR_2010_214]
MFFYVTDYTGNYIYKNGTLEFFNHAEGYVEKEADGYKYVYQFKDHLQNVRLSYSDKNKDGSISQDEIIQENNYYPFGLQHKGYNFAVNGRKHQWGFVGKEEQNELGLGWIDIDARNYNPELGRWMNIDQKSELFYGWTPYKYGMNNPILLSDPDGNCEFCKKVLKSAVNAYKTTLSNTYEGAKQLVNSPIQTVKKAASNHFSKLSSPQGLVSLAKDAASVATAGMTNVASDVVESALSQDSASTIGNKIGERAADVTVEAAAIATGELVGKGLKSAVKALKNVGKAKTSKSFATKTFDESRSLVNDIEFSGTISGEGGAMTVEIELILADVTNTNTMNQKLIKSFESIASENGMSNIKVIGTVVNETSAAKAAKAYIEAGYNVSTKTVNGATELTRTKTLK